MGWKDLLQTSDERKVLPWVGEISLRSRTPVQVVRSGNRTWTIAGKPPAEHGWYSFVIDSRTARWVGAPATDPPDDGLEHLARGYLVGDRFVNDNARVDPDPKVISASSEPVHLIEPGLDRFVRIVVGRSTKDGPLIYKGYDMPQGSEEAVLAAFLDEKLTVDDIPGVPAALDAAFRMETWQRVEARRRREELERLRREEEARLAAEERHRKLAEQLGDAQGRRAMALVDFEQAARAALTVGGATYLDHRNSVRKDEKVVRFRFANRRFECVCDARTLAIIDSGICLIDHDTDEKGDTRFTLESLPGVIQEAIDEGKLVVFRHVN